MADQKEVPKGWNVPLHGSNPPISEDLAPMVYVNNKLYQYTDSQLDFTDKESQFTYLGEIESKVRDVYKRQVVDRR